MKVKISEKYRIRRDPLNFIVEKITKKGKWIPEAHHSRWRSGLIACTIYLESKGVVVSDEDMVTLESMVESASGAA